MGSLTPLGGQETCCSPAASSFHLCIFTFWISTLPTPTVKHEDYVCIYLNLLLLWAKILVSGVCDYVPSTPESSSDWWSTATRYRDVQTDVFIQAEAANISIRTSPNGLWHSEYGTASFCHKILCWPGWIFKKRKQNALSAFDTEDHYFSTRAAILHYSAGWEDSAWCWRGPLSDTNPSHAVGSLLAWQEGSAVNWTAVLYWRHWIDFALVLLVICQVVKFQLRYFQRSTEFTFKGLLWSMQEKGSKSRNLNIKTFCTAAYGFLSQAYSYIL